MQRLRAAYCLTIATAVTAMMTASAQAELLSSEAIRKLVVGKTFYLAAPLGGEFPLKYSADGTVNGDGTAVGLGRFLATKETGRWFIKDTLLCQQFKTWYSGERICFTLESLGADKYRWVRDNGESGIARLAP